MACAISVEGVSKAYRLYPRPGDRVRQLLAGRRRRYYSEAWALRDLTVAVPRGATVGVLGRNGSGKSTLLQLIAGVLQPTSGSLAVQGSVAAMLELGAGFHPDFTGRENVMVYGAVRGAPRAQVRSLMPDIERFAAIGEALDRPVRTYSAGMLMRLAFGAAVHIPADVLVIDELLAVGDAFFQSKCVAKLQELQAEGATLVVVSHDMSLVRSLCSEAMVLEQGRLLFHGDASEAAERYYKACAASEGSRDLPAFGTDGARRYGNGRARLRRYRVCGEDSPRAVRVESGSEVDVELEFEFSERMVDPIVGIMLKAPSGIELFGSNTWHRGVPVGECVPGDPRSVRFRFKALLHNGPYLLTMTICEPNPAAGIVYMDRHVDACLIEVSGGPAMHSGFCNLDTGVEVGGAS